MSTYVAGFSSAVRQAEFDKAYPTLSRAKDLRLLWICCGKEDSLMPANQAFAQYLTDHGVKSTFHESPGAHTWMVWRHYLNELAPMLFQ
jgi:enterochelin esterase family protein